MTSKRVRPKAKPVRLLLPEWIMGGQPEDVGAACGWDVQTTEDPAIWSIVSKEGVHGTNGGLLRMFKMADR